MAQAYFVFLTQEREGGKQESLALHFVLEPGFSTRVEDSNGIGPFEGVEKTLLHDSFPCCHKKSVLLSMRRSVSFKRSSLSFLNGKFMFLLVRVTCLDAIVLYP